MLARGRGALLACLALASHSAGAGDYLLFFLGGQSNMVGYGLISELTLAQREPVPGAVIFHGQDAPDGAAATGEGAWRALGPGHGDGFASVDGAAELSIRFGPELSFARGLIEAGLARVAIVKYARNGTGIDREAAGPNGSWEPGGPGPNQLDHARAAIARALAAGDVDGDGRDDRLRPAGIVWMQGESDAAYGELVARRYAAHLAKVLEALREALGAPDLPVALGRISDSRAARGRPVWPHGAIVRRAQAAYAGADACATLVTETDGYRYSDRWHYDTAGYLDLGRRFADAMLESPCYRARPR